MTPADVGPIGAALAAGGPNGAFGIRLRYCFGFSLNIPLQLKLQK